MQLIRVERFTAISCNEFLFPHTVVNTRTHVRMHTYARTRCNPIFVQNTRYTAIVHYLVTENEEECFRLNSSPYAGGEQQGVEGEDGNANQQADYKRSRTLVEQQQRRRPRPQVEGGAASVANLLALCSASLDGQRYSFKISASADNESCE
ncbi:hypothetical protein D917_02305 [Trichinella nativa]|uniref:Uncharacterized protein n=1 Tax=Trichinella nativa TaxID=6335 RepID=A0A1Y3EKM6_9BILA|nr:hypothetical protein D917_02305 [Trichinella nativa]